MSLPRPSGDGDAAPRDNDRTPPNADVLGGMIR